MAEPNARTLHVIDGSGYIYRAFYAIRPLSTRDGTPTNAVIGFAKMLGKLLREEQPHHLGIAFDPKGKTFRHEAFVDYKKTRQKTPEDLGPQIPLIRELVTAMDIPILEVAGYEADDVIATITARALEVGLSVVVVSADKDLMQLVGDEVQMFDPMKDQRFDVAGVEKKWGVPPERVADLLALAGDTSDNIPGVPKVGQKSAAALVNAYGDIEAVIEGLSKRDSGKDKLKGFERSVLDHVEEARLSKRLTVLARDVPIALDTDALRYNLPDADKLGAFLRRIEAYGLLRELGLGPDGGAAAAPGSSAVPAAAPAPATALLPFAAPAPAPSVASTVAASAVAASAAAASAAAAAADVDPSAAAASAAPDVVIIDRSSYRIVTGAAELAELLAAARASRELCIVPQTSNDPPQNAEIIGVGLAVPGLPAVYVPIAHRYLGVPKQLRRAEVLDALAPVLGDPAVRTIGYDLKHTYRVLAGHRIPIATIGAEVIVAAYVLDPSRASFTLDALAREVLGHESIRPEDVMGRGQKHIPFDEVDVATAATFAAERADLAAHLCVRLEAEIDAAGLGALYRDLELPLLPVLAAMEIRGIRVDAGMLGELSREFTERLSAIEARAHHVAGEPFNLASTKQLGVLFFDKLGYPVQRKTKTGYSTDHEVLETLARDYELPRVVLEHRILAKLKSTYVDGLLKVADPASGRVHTTYNQAGAATGRLSSTDPNLQNIPIRTEEGRRIRDAFVAGEGCELISADYSQIELRIMAHLSRDESFIDAFLRNEDIHRRTAMEVLTDGEEPGPDARRKAKAINFGILYGQSAFGLGRTLGIPNREASEYIQRYFARYPGIRRFLDETIRQTAERGYVTTMFGRRRFVPEIQSANRTRRQAAERIAMNTPIQGAAADLIKLAMVRVARALQARRLAARLLLQVHDELVLEAPSEERPQVVDVVRTEMSQVMELAVPLVVDIGWGRSWTAAHP